MRGLITAFRTLTIIPLPGKDAEKFSSALFFFPVVGGLVGLLTALAAWGVGYWLRWPLGAGVAAIALSTVVTGGIHLDGLADGFDSFGGRTRERKLEIMKDPRVGSYGVMALVIVLLAKFVSFYQLSESGHYAVMVLPFIASRTLQVAPVVWLPYARAEGGTGKPFVNGANPLHFLVALVLATGLCFWAAGAEGTFVLVAACVLAAIVMAWMKRTFGGMTGDLLGLTSEIVETFVLVGLAVAA